MSHRSGRNRRARAGVVSLVLYAALLPPLSGCSDAGPTSPNQFVSSALALTLPPEIEEGQTVQASLGAGGEGAIWVTSDPTVATVDGRGMIRGRKAGEVQILAAKGGNSANARLKVRGMKVEISPDSATIASVGGTAQLQALVTYKDGTPVPNPDLQWSSTNDGIATVDGGGKVVGRAVGLALIAVVSSGRSDTVPVRVGQAAVASVAVAPSSATLDVGKAVQLSATVRDTESNIVASARVSWTSSNSSVALVDATGGVTALAGGSATVTAAFQGKSGSAQITVNAPAAAPASPPPAAGGAMEPSGSSVITDRNFATKASVIYDTVGSQGWGTEEAKSSQISIIDVTGAPISATKAAKFRFPQGSIANEATYTPGLCWKALQASKRTLYARFAMRFSPNFVFNYGSGNQKMMLATTNGAGARLLLSFITYEGDRSAGYATPGHPINIDMILNDNINGGRHVRLSNNIWNPSVTRGDWHVFEVMAVLNDANAKNGILRVRMDGKDIASHANVEYLPAGLTGSWSSWKVAPYWGGGGGTIPEDMDIQLDHVYISQK